MDKGEIIIYQTSDGQTELDVRLEGDTVWLSQSQLAQLLQVRPQNITMHIRNVYKEGELERSATCKNFLQVQQEGKRHVNRIVKMYNLDVIISVGYRVKSLSGTKFRQWATKLLKEHLLGTSIKDLGKKLFTFTKMEMNAKDLMRFIGV